MLNFVLAHFACMQSNHHHLRLKFQEDKYGQRELGAREK
jgi:hypothetical protein